LINIQREAGKYAVEISDAIGLLARAGRSSGRDIRSHYDAADQASSR
jgi:hypothetical protein